MRQSTGAVLLGGACAGFWLFYRALPGRRPTPAPPAASTTTTRPESDDATVQAVVVEAASFASCHGMLVVSRDDDQLLHHIPVALGPTTFPRRAFEKALAIGPDYNLIYDRISRNSEWLLSTLASTLASDEFTAKLVDIYNTVLREGIRQPLSLAINRSDYMVHVEPGCSTTDVEDIRQVEFNTISSSFGPLSAQVTAMHQSFASRYAKDSHTRSLLNLQDLEADSLPENAALIANADAMRLAFLKYNSPEAVILFVVQEGERNVMDQRMLEYAVSRPDDSGNPGPRVLRRSLREIAETGSLHPVSGALLLDGAVEVAIAYFRAGYTPTDFPSQVQWDARLLIEQSLAIKSPNIPYHLAGTKKVQQHLATPGELERFTGGDDTLASTIRSSFAGIWALDGSDPSQASVVAGAIAEPDNYVLKPQREGGGNNFYGDQVKQKLQSMSKSELASHVLMERILPPTRTATLVRLHSATACNAINELGVFGQFVGDGKRVHLNEAKGHLLRTKAIGTDEGGVATGYSCLSSPRLVR